MAKQLYRKSLLERMSSPEQLDKMIIIASPSFWLAILGGALIIAVALVWSIFGTLPIKTEATGLFVPDQGTYQVTAKTSGIVSSLEVAPGDSVEQGDLLMTLSDEDVQEELNRLFERRARVEAITLDSQNDIVTADNRDLINLKTQISVSGLEQDQQEAMLASYQAELTAMTPKVNAAKKAMEQAKLAYYDVMDTGSVSTEIQMNYQEAQSEYSQASAQYESASVNADSARATYNNALYSVLNTLQNQIQAQIDARKAQLAGGGNTGGETSTGSQLEHNTAAIQAEIDALEALNTKVKRAKGTGVSPNALHQDVKTVLGADICAQLEQLWMQYKTARDVLYSVEYDYDDASDSYDKAANAYKKATDTATQESIDKEQLMADYNEKSTDYQALYSQRSNLEANILSLESQIQAANVGKIVSIDSYQQQFHATRSAILDSLDYEIDKYQYALEKTQITAAVSGVVSDIKVGLGSAVGQGSEVVMIRQLSEEDLIVCYIPINTGKKIEPGMEAIVCPTTVNKNEYGHMRAEVVQVDDYISSVSGIRSMLGDDTLVQAFTQNGPVVGVICKLQTDENTASGYWWSNKKGGELMVPEGTLVTVDIITEKKAPITMLIPYLKDKVTNLATPDSEA